jgi:hypothetical protein
MKISRFKKPPGLGILFKIRFKEPQVLGFSKTSKKHSDFHEKLAKTHPFLGGHLIFSPKN